MCGAFGLRQNLQAYRLGFKVDFTLFESFKPMDIVRPGTYLPITTNDEPSVAQYGYWGYPIHWSGKEKNLINARVETIFEKPTFRKSAIERRCIIFADGFYEWKEINGKKKPFYFALKTFEPFAFAGIWKLKETPKGEIPGFVILTTEPNSVVEPIHDRMPVILNPDQAQDWLNESKITSSKVDLQML